MTSTKPYLLRALYEWCVDSGFTPYLAVAVDQTTRVPREFVRDGQIVLNVGPEATSQLLISNEDVSFQARFSGKVFPVMVPVGRVAAIYARENGEGMAFEVIEPGDEDAATEGKVELLAAEESVEADVTPPPQPDIPRPAKGSHLTRVK